MDDTASTSSPGPPGVPAELAFPGAVRLELDDLLDQVIARAGELKTVQGRLRKLLAATQHIAQRPGTDELQQRVVESARSLVDARYGALGVVDDGHLTSFVYSGLSDEEAAAIGHLPDGEGVLGTVIGDPRPLRLRDLTEHPSAVGFPPHHPPMGSFLGVPLWVGGTVFGHLYLTEKQGAAEFSRDDEELVTALAAAAGVAIENALLLEGARRRARWQAAAADLSRRLLTGSLGPSAGLRHLLEEALALTDAQGAVVSSVDEDDPAAVAVLRAAGVLASLEGRRFTDGETITGAALASDRALVIPSVAGDRRAAQLLGAAPQVGSALAIRISEGIAGDGTRSVLLLVRDAGRAPFGAEDIDMVEGLAAQATATLALARSRADREALRRVEDRELLVADLNTRVLQRLLLVGTALSSAASAASGATQDRVLAQVDELEDLVRELRRAIWKGPAEGPLVASPPEEAPPALA
ncbi:GAF domain-containing protein [Actinomycetospora sp.]|uniref:GAF domain-containing protein n=1 Tax=Actinomycetospora sp. TaxID=1872135 RepID=UPI002F3FEDA8